jgi:glycerophosphoryl diester phosphodiesterase
MEFPFGATVAVAHRGAHGEDRPENSLSAVERTVEIGARAVEFDVVPLPDGRLAVSHDPYEEGIPAPPEVGPFLRVVASSELLLNLDWKGCGGEERVCTLLRRYGLVERTVVSSTDRQALVRLKDALPGVTTGLSVTAEVCRTAPGRSMAPARISAWIRESRADAVMLDRRVASGEAIETVRGAGAGVFLWTAESKETYEKLATLSPDGIATDTIEQHI